MRHKYSTLFAIAAFAFFLCCSTGFASILDTADEFAVLGGSTVTNTGSSEVTGDVGVSPGSAIVGFDVPGGPGTVSGTIDAADPVAAQAHIDASNAFTGLSNMPYSQNLTGQDLGNLTLTPGVYHFDSSAQLTGSLTLDSQGNNNASWVFQIGSTLTTASSSSVSLTHPGSNNGVFWEVGSSATIGKNTAFIGNIIADQSITLTTDANILSGRALALNGAVTMDTNKINTNGDLGSGSQTISGGLERGSGGQFVPVSGEGGPSSPEPISATLFLLGGGALAARKLRKKKEALPKLT